MARADIIDVPHLLLTLALLGIGLAGASRADTVVVTAGALGRCADVGAISVGRFGDIVGVAGDPLAGVTRLQSVAFVMKAGDVVKGLPD
jgi:hypothetical protein